MSAAWGLLKLSVAKSAAVILFTPDCMIQDDKVWIACKAVCFTVKLYLVFLQIKCLANDMVSDALHPHTENLLLL